MDDREALHTAARRYCISLVPWLNPRAGEADYNNPDAEPEESAQDGDESREEYWREELLPAILREIERRTPDDFTTLDELRSFLDRVGREAAYVPWEARRSTAPTPQAEDIAAMTAERERFCAFVAGLTTNDLAGVEPLPFRRTLSEAEIDTIWEDLHRRWPSHALWLLTVKELEAYDHQLMENVLTFWRSRFAENVPLTTLRAVLRDAGVERVLCTGGDAYEVDVDAFVPLGVEAHFTSSGYDWVMYHDHEDRMVVAGEPIISLLSRVWPSWRRYEDEDYSSDWFCPRCGTELRMDHSFHLYCPDCGVQGDESTGIHLQSTYRPEWGVTQHREFLGPSVTVPLSEDQVHFCPEDGSHLRTDHTCPKCGRGARWVGRFFTAPSADGS